MERIFKDREVQYPNRIRLVPVEGQEGVYDVERAEGTVIEPGTVLDAALFNAMEEDIEEKAKQDGSYSTLKSGGNVIVDTRTVNSPPSYYADKETCYEFKSRDTLGLIDYMPSSSYVVLTTKKGWVGSYVIYQEAVSAGNDQSSVNDSVKCYRYGLGETWGEWQVVAKTSQVVRTDVAQTLTDGQRQQAQNNIALSKYVTIPANTSGWRKVANIPSYTQARLCLVFMYNLKNPVIATFEISHTSNFSDGEAITFMGTGGSGSSYSISAIQILENGDVNVNVTNQNATTYCKIFLEAYNKDGNFSTLYSFESANTSSTVLKSLDILNGINTTGGVYQNGAPVLAIDPTKLTPSTDNEWSEITVSQNLPEAGLFAVKIKRSSMDFSGIVPMFYDGSTTIEYTIPVGPGIVATVSYDKNRGATKWVAQTNQSGELIDLDIASIWYKRIG